MTAPLGSVTVPVTLLTEPCGPAYAAQTPLRAIAPKRTLITLTCLSLKWLRNTAPRPPRRTRIKRGRVGPGQQQAGARAEHSPLHFPKRRKVHGRPEREAQQPPRPRKRRRLRAPYSRYRIGRATSNGNGAKKNKPPIRPAAPESQELQ